MTTARLWISSDHGGNELKKFLMNSRPGLDWKDLGPFDDASVDYPDYADKLAAELKKDSSAIGVLICGSGQGMAIRANRYPHIRAALCYDAHIAELARSHNNANVLCMGGRVIDHQLALQIFDKFLKTPFEGGRHERRVQKLSQNC